MPWVGESSVHHKHGSDKSRQISTVAPIWKFTDILLPILPDNRRSSSSSNIPLHVTRTKGATTLLKSIPYRGNSFPFLVPGAATAAIKGSAN